MGVIVENMREIHQLGAATREWLVSGKRVPGFRATHTRIAGYTEARADYAFVRHDPAFSMILVTESGAANSTEPVLVVGLGAGLDDHGEPVAGRENGVSLRHDR